MEKRKFEQMEGVFHHHLGTYSELVLANELIKRGLAEQALFDSTSHLASLQAVIDEMEDDHPHRAIWTAEIRNIELAAQEATELLARHEYVRDLVLVEHTAGEYSDGQAGDVRIVYADGTAEPISLKTDKSGKVALAGGQTGLEQWADRLYGVPAEELEDICRRRVKMDLKAVREDYQDASHLMQWTVRETLGVSGGMINDWRDARATDEAATHRLLRNVKRDLNGADDALVLVLERATGRVGVDAVVEAIDPDDVKMSDISFTPCRPRKGRYGTTLGFKFQGAKLFDHQVKHKRGKNPSDRFNDVTTRASRATGEPHLTDRHHS